MPNVEPAAAYARERGLHALVVADRERILYEEYAGGYSVERQHALYSGTKSFWGTAAIEAAREGLFALDDPVAGTLTEFRNDERASITPRMLLQLTAGYGFGGLGSAVPTYEKALAMPLKSTPGSRFTYGGVPLQVFGAYFVRACSASGTTPHEFLTANVLQPAGVSIASWRTLSDGTHPLPTGVQLTASSWLAYGRWMLRHCDRYADAFAGSVANPRYGLGWWLAFTSTPRDLFYASGSGGQALYVIPSLDLLVVHFSNSSSYKHEAFLKRLLSEGP